jgi:hypothetical protein
MTFGKLGERVISGFIWGFIGLVLATMFQKKLDWFYGELWLRFSPETISFESTKVSGCSGGEIGNLVQAAERQGLQVDSQVAKSFLCASWAGKGPPTRRVLEDIATKFDNCFTIDTSFTTPRLVLRTINTAICSANFELDEKNQWKPAILPIYICRGEALSAPKVLPCTLDILKTLGFTH